MIKIFKAELEFLKGFNPVELEKYLILFPERSKTTNEFKRQYTWVRGQWKKK